MPSQPRALDVREGGLSVVACISHVSFIKVDLTLDIGLF